MDRRTPKYRCHRQARARRRMVANAASVSARRRACPVRRARGRVADEMRDYRANLSAIRGHWLDNAPFGAPLPFIAGSESKRTGFVSWLGVGKARARRSVAGMILLSLSHEGRGKVGRPSFRPSHACGRERARCAPGRQLHRRLAGQERTGDTENATEGECAGLPVSATVDIQAMEHAALSRAAR
jgi:hypothetical protein